MQPSFAVLGIDFVSPINLTNVIALLGLAPHVVDLIKKLKDYRKSYFKSAKQIFDFDFYKSLTIAALICVFAILKNCSDERKETASAKETKALNDSLFRVNQKLLSKQDEIDAVNKEIKAIAYRIIDTSQIITHLAKKNLQLQEELSRQANSSKSFPLLSAAIIDISKLEPDYDGDPDNVLRFVLYLKNTGKYDISNVRVSYSTRIRRLVDNVEQIPIDEVPLGAGETRIIKEWNLKDVAPIFPYPRSYKFTVTWKGYRYTLDVDLPAKAEDGSLTEINTQSLYHYYTAEGIETKNKEEFVKAMLKKIK